MKYSSLIIVAAAACAISAAPTGRGARESYGTGGPSSIQHQPARGGSREPPTVSIPSGEGNKWDRMPGGPGTTPNQPRSNTSGRPRYGRNQPPPVNPELIARYQELLRADARRQRQQEAREQRRQAEERRRQALLAAQLADIREPTPPAPVQQVPAIPPQPHVFPPTPPSTPPPPPALRLNDEEMDTDAPASVNSRPSTPTASVDRSRLAPPVTSATG